MSESQISIETTSLRSPTRRKRPSFGSGMVIGLLLGIAATTAVSYLLNGRGPDHSRRTVAASSSPPTAAKHSVAEVQAGAAGDQGVSPKRLDIAGAVTDGLQMDADERIQAFEAPLAAEHPISPEAAPATASDGGPLIAVKVPPAAKNAKPDGAGKSDKNKSGRNPNTKPKATDKKDVQKHKEIELSDHRWTTLVLFRGNERGEARLPKNLPIWNYEKGYAFAGSGVDQHRLGNFQVDGEFVIRNGYLRREFGNSALLHLPAAENFELEGIIHLAGVGGWMVLLGWDDETRSGHVVYNTRLKVSGSSWFLVEIKNGKPVAKSERLLVRRDAQGEGPLRILVNDKKLSMQAAGDYLFREEELPNYKAGHVAIGTFSPKYGPQNVGIRSLRMRLR